MRTLAPGLYMLVPVEWNDEDDDGNAVPETNSFATDPDACYNSFGESQYVELPNDFDPDFGTIVDSPVGPAGTVILTLDLDDGFPYDSVWPTSVNSPLGPLSIRFQYALMPTTSRTLCKAPGGQDATNWLVLDLADETTVAVDGGRILIGPDVVDVGAGPDFQVRTYSLDGIDVQWGDVDRDSKARVVTTKNVIRAGTDLHVLLMGMINGEDDGVMAFANTDAAGLAAVQAIDTPEAKLIAAELSTHIDEGFIGTVLSFYVKGNVLPQERIDSVEEHQRANLVNA